MAGGREAYAIKGPPEATVARRAKSFGDFYDVVRGYLKIEDEGEGEAVSLEQGLDGKPKRMSVEEIGTERELYDWYNGLEDKLVQAGNDEFVLVDRITCHLDVLYATYENKA